MSRRITILVIWVAFSPFCLTTAGSRDDAHALLRQATAQLAREDTERDGIRALLKLGRARDASVAARATLVLARHYRSTGKVAEALEVLEPFSNYDRRHLEEHTFRCVLERARCLGAGGQLAQAIKTADFVEENTEGCIRALGRAAKGDIELSRDQPREAIARYNQAIAYGNSFYRPIPGVSPTDPPQPVPGHAKWPPVRKEIQDRLKQAQLLLEQEDLGTGYLAYRQARTLQLAGKSREAATRYDTIAARYPNTVYATAAALYREQCRIAAGDHDQAVQRLGDFCARDRLGLYRGEAMFTVADLFLTRGLDAKSALPWFDRCIAWCDAAAGVSRRHDLTDVPPKALTVSRPPATSQRPGDFGSIVRLPPDPGAIVNRETAAWYLRDLQRDSLYYRGLIRFHREDYAGADADFAAARDLDPLMKALRARNAGTFARRLEAACKLHFMVTEPEQLQKIGRGMRLRFLLADFQLLWEHYGRSVALYTAILDDPRATPEDRAAALVGLSHNAFRTGDDQGMTAHLLRVTREFPRTRSHPIALLALGANGKLPQEQRSRYLLEAYRRHRNTSHGLRAYFTYGMNQRGQGNRDECRRVMNTILTAHADSDYAPLARQILASMHNANTVTPTIR